MVSAAEAGVRPTFSLGYRRWMLGLLVAIYACSFIDRIIINTVGPQIIKELRLSDLQFGLLGGLSFAVFYAALGIPIARVAERRSRVNIISACIALWSVATALCGISTNYWQLLLFRMGVGVGEGGCGPAAQSLISDHYPPRQRASALAIYTAGVPLGSMLGAVAGGWIAQTFSWRTAFIVVGLPGLLLALLARFTLREPVRGHSEAAEVAAQAPPFSAVLKRLFASPTFRHVCAGFVLTNFAANGVNVFMPSYLVRSFHLGLAEVGLLYGLVVGSSGMVGALAGGFGADFAARRDVRWYAWTPALAAAFAFPVYLIAFTRGSAVETAAFFGLAYVVLSLYFAPTFAVVQNLVEPRMRASAAALLLLLINVFGQGLGPTLMGFASDTMARRSFTLGDYASLCPAAKGAAPALAKACVQASASGLQVSMLAVSGFFVWGAVHYLLAARTIRRELDQRAGAPAPV